uniref:Goadsporin biosynthetic protein n=1 Tax=Streptomyces sp. TP-A0584 TaxID=314563 RepID=Q3C2F8_9ACTN|nr:goadsporin biosynthetic protein [Streptomyces sp. TP-A0584]
MIRRVVRLTAGHAHLVTMAYSMSLALVRLGPSFLTLWFLRTDAPSAGLPFGGFAVLLSISIVVTIHAVSRRRDHAWTEFLDRIQQHWERHVWRELVGAPSSALRAVPLARLIKQAGTPARCRGVVAMVSMDTLLTPVCACLALVGLAAVTPWFGLTLLAAFTVLTGLVTLLQSLSHAAASRRESEHDDQALLHSVLANIDELQVYGSAPAALGQWQHARALRRAVQTRTRTYEAWCEGLLHGSVWWFTGAVAVAAILRHSGGAQLLAGILAIAPLSAALAPYGQALPAILDVRNALRTEPKAVRSGAADPYPAVRPRENTHPIQQGLVRLHDVSYTYPGSVKPVLRNISFTVRSGESIVLTGPSGAGKTTLVRLLLGLESPTTGMATYVRGFGRGDLRIAYVAQDERPGAIDLGTFLAGDDYSAQEARIREVAEVTGADEFLRMLPLGFKTPASHLSAHFATGQWQRLMLTRALLKEPHLLVLDEALSALDPLSQREIAEALRTHAVTCITVTHDRHTIGAAHRVLALGGDGRLVHDGRPEADASLHCVDDALIDGR